MLHEPWWNLGFLKLGEIKLLLVLWTASYMFGCLGGSASWKWCLLHLMSPWQWLGQAPATPADVQSIASVSSGIHREQNPHGVCLCLLLFSYRTNAWELSGIPGLRACGRTAALPFCMLTALPCLFRYAYYGRGKANSTWHVLCLTGRILGSVPCTCSSWTTPSSQGSVKISSH